MCPDKPLTVHSADRNTPFHAVDAVLFFFLNPDFKKNVFMFILRALKETKS